MDIGVERFAIRSSLAHNLRFKDAHGSQTFQAFDINDRSIHDLAVVGTNIELPRDGTSFGVTLFTLQGFKILARIFPICCTCRS